MKSESLLVGAAVILCAFLGAASGQRISTIQLDGVQYFISRMNPYSPELNYFLAYQYCRSLGLQLTSFETREKADVMTSYLQNAGYSKHDFWTSGNRLGTDMMLWMSTGLPFNATFDYMRKPHDEETGEEVSGATAEGDAENEARSDDGASHSCVALKGPDHRWVTDDCTAVKDFICEQTRCYYYNYGSVPVSAAQGTHRPQTTPAKLPPPSTATPAPPTAAPSTSALPPTITEPPLPPLLNLTVKRGMHLRASTAPPTPPSVAPASSPQKEAPASSPRPPSVSPASSPRPASVAPASSPRPAPAGPLLVSSIIASIEKAQRLKGDAPPKVSDDHSRQAGRNVDGMNGSPNVVYVKAVGAQNGQAGWSLAYVDDRDEARPVHRATSEYNKRRVLEPHSDT